VGGLVAAGGEDAMEWWRRGLARSRSSRRCGAPSERSDAAGKEARVLEVHAKRGCSRGPTANSRCVARKVVWQVGAYIRLRVVLVPRVRR